VTVSLVPDPDCLDENVVARHLSGEGTEEERGAVRAHIDVCERCRELLSALVRTLVTPDGEGTGRRALPRGTNLGRYVLLDAVGRGGMGVVYAAFDPELDRKVAIKLVRATVEGAGVPPRVQLLAEAQAIARLSHPNIVTVHDVGTVGSELFFAMEYVKGETLRRAQRAGAAGLQRTLGLYLAAGEGLAAAHRSGIVHGDFKPENVLVGEDGRVRVTDFGLARAVQEAAPRFAGTPAYMAPELWRGQPHDLRTDQYAFCVALLEAVEGKRPPEVDQASPSVPPNPIAVPSHLPPRLVRLLSRGLSSPEHRWPSMDALLTELRQARLPFRRSTAAIAVLLFLLTGVLFAQNAFISHRIHQELRSAAERLPELFRQQSELIDLQVNAGVRAEGVLSALGQASNMDAALGLADDESREGQLAASHESLRSADLPGLKGRDALLLANYRGRVILNQAEPGSFGTAAPALPILTDALEESPGDALWSAATLRTLPLTLVHPLREDDLLFVSSRPVVRGQSMLGLILTGAWVSEGLLAELGRAAGARVVLRAPDGGWAGAHWAAPPPLGKVLRLDVDGESAEVFGIRLGAPGTRTPAGDAYLVHVLSADEATGLGSSRVRWTLLALCALTATWLLWRVWRSGWLATLRTERNIS